jgi:anti-sigma factor RsiW
MTDPRGLTPLSCDEARDLAAGFVLGALEPAEMDAVREHLATCPEAHPEFAELGGAVPYLADSLEPVEPSAGLGRRISAAVAAEAAASASGGAPVEATSPSAPERPSQGSIVSLSAERERRRSALTWVAAIAAVLVIVGLGAWNVSLRRDIDAAQAYAAAVDRVLALAATPGGQAAILAPSVADGPSGIAAVGADGQVQIAMRGLAPTAGTEVYEAWVIGADAQPVAIGSFNPNADGFGSLAVTGAPTASGVTIALTREPSAGRTTPTPPVLSSGVASGST